MLKKYCRFLNKSHPECQTGNWISGILSEKWKYIPFVRLILFDFRGQK